MHPIQVGIFESFLQVADRSRGTVIARAVNVGLSDNFVKQTHKISHHKHDKSNEISLWNANFHNDPLPACR